MAPTPPTKAEAHAPRTPFETTRSLELKLAPQRDPAGDGVTLEVSMRFTLPPTEFGDTTPLVLRVRDAGGEAGAEGRLEELFARDGEGALAFVRLPADGAQRGQLAFKAERRMRGPLSLSYRVRVPTGNALALGAHGGSFMGLGRSFLLLPATQDAYALRVKWDLAEAGAGAQGTSSLGEGDFERETRLAELEGAVWAGGALERLIAHDARRGAHFEMTLAGWTDPNALEVSAWTGRVWLAGRTLATGEGGAPSLELFLHAGPSAGVAASALGEDHVLVLAGSSRVLSWPLKRALSRAVARAVLGFTVRDKAVPSRWFEGFVTYWAYHFLRWGRLDMTAEVHADLAASTERYFASPLRDKPLAELAGGGEAEAQHAEDRGLLYAGELYGSIRALKNPERTLEGFMRDLARAASREGGGPAVVEESAFVAAVEGLLGKKGQERFEAVVLGRGALPEVPDSAYGLCFDKVKKKIKVGSGKETVEGFSWIRRVKPPEDCEGAAEPR